MIGVLRPRSSDRLIGLEFLNIREPVELIELDLLDKCKVGETIKNYQPSEVYNLAAQSSVGMSFSIPVDTYEFNTLSVLNLLEGIRKFSPETRFYQTSSSEMFGEIGEYNLLIKESFLFQPVSPYGISKASAHWVTINYRKAFGLIACCGILFNHESCRWRSHFVIKKIIRSAIQIKMGNENRVTLGNLSVKRDWGYSPKFVEAIWLMLQQDKFDDYLICSGHETSLKDFLMQPFSKLGLDVADHLDIGQSLLRSQDLKTIYGDNARAKGELGWDYDIPLAA